MDFGGGRGEIFEDFRNALGIRWKGNNLSEKQRTPNKTQRNASETLAKTKRNPGETSAKPKQNPRKTLSESPFEPQRNHSKTTAKRYRNPSVIPAKPCRASGAVGTLRKLCEPKSSHKVSA